MPGFKRRPLSGSDELFRATGRDAAGSGGEVVELSEEELRWLLEGIQALRYPERARSRLTMSQFDEVGLLQDKLRDYLGGPAET
jgi:hypothetical protein